MPILFGTIASSNQQARADTGVMFPIQMVSVGAAGSSYIEFTSIPSTYKHLQIRGISRSDSAGLNQLYFTFNSDTGSNYANHILFGEGSSVTATKVQPAARMSLGLHAGATTTASMFGACVVDILDYATASKNRVVRSLSGVDASGLGGYVWYASGLWVNTSAVTSIKIVPENGAFVQYTQFALYGIKGA